MRLNAYLAVCGLDEIKEEPGQHSASVNQLMPENSAEHEELDDALEPEQQPSVNEIEVGNENENEDKDGDK